MCRIAGQQQLTGRSRSLLARKEFEASYLYAVLLCKSNRGWGAVWGTGRRSNLVSLVSFHKAAYRTSVRLRTPYEHEQCQTVSIHT